MSRLRRPGDSHHARILLVGMLALSIPPLEASSAQDCRRVTTTENLQQAVDSVPAGGAACLEAGIYSGPLSLKKSLTLSGPRSAVIVSPGSGSTITIAASGVRLLGFTIRGSGNRFDHNDSALKVSGRNISLEGLLLEGALFGLTVEQASNVIFRGNEIIGDTQRSLGLRGDSIRLWQTRDSVIEDNDIVGCRDIIIWYSSHNQIIHNEISDGRYGTHMMYSEDEEIIGNHYRHTVVGVFSMYTQKVKIRGNVIEDASQFDGMGIGVKDSDGLLVEGNRLIRDNTGIYLDASPAAAPRENLFRRNMLLLNNTAVILHATESNTAFISNVFRANRAVALVEGNGDALSTEWAGNYFDDYQGYDLGHDGTGDIPYELRSFSTDLVERYPNLALFRGSPAMFLMEFFSKVFPYLQPKLILRDLRPRMAPAAIRSKLYED